MYQMGYIEKYGTGITENIRRMQEARLLAPEIDLSAEFVTTIWRDNDATNVATNVATSKDYLAVNKRIIDRKVKKKVKKRMSEQQLQECIIEACYVEHSVEELAKLLG